MNQYKVRKGIYTGRCPYGYKYDHENKQISIIEDEIFTRIDESVEHARFAPGFALYLQILS